MEKPKFTPGPWWTDGQYIEDEAGLAVIAANTDSGPLPGNPTRGMAAFASEHLPENAQTCTANAHLISAAPDLYAALQALDESWTKDCPEGPDGACRVLGGVLSEPTRTIWRNARAALSKANGESGT